MSDLDFRALWDQALTYEEFVKQSTEHCALWTGVYRLANIPAWALERACERGRTLRLLVLAEDWCGDASNTVPTSRSSARRRTAWRCGSCGATSTRK